MSEKEQIAALIEFARWAISESSFQGADLGGGDIQDKAHELGLLVEATISEPCSEDHCACADADVVFPTTCFRFAGQLVRTSRQEGQGQASPPAVVAEPVAVVCLTCEPYSHGHMVEAQLQIRPGTELPIGTQLYAHAPPKPAGYDPELVARMLEDAATGGNSYTLHSILEQARLLRAADNADAAGVHTASKPAGAATLLEIPHDPRTNGSTEPCDAPNGEYACSCGAWHDKPACTPLVSTPGETTPVVSTIGAGFGDKTLIPHPPANSPAAESVVAAAKAVIQRWDSPLWRQGVGTAEIINGLRNAIAQQTKDTK